MKFFSSQQLLAWAQALPIQLTLILAGLIVATALLSWFPESWLIQEQLEQQAWSQVEQGRRITQSLYRQQSLEANDLAEYIALLPEVRRLLQADMDSTLGNDLYMQLRLHLNLLNNQANFDLLLICNDDNEIVMQLGAIDSPTSAYHPLCANTNEGTSPSENTRQEDVYLFASATNPEAWWLTTKPIGDELGKLVLGQALNDLFAIRMHAQTGLEHTILVNDQPVATSLARLVPQASPRPNTAFRTLLPAPPARTTPVTGQTHVTFGWNGIPYYGSQVMLLSPMLVDEVALDVSTLGQVKERIMRSQLMSLVLLGLTGVLVAALLARHISGSLSKLAQAAVQFSAGDLESPVPISQGVREVTQVAQSLEQARLDLRHMVVALQREKAWSEYLLQAIVEGIMTLDKAGYITFWSLGAERITGWSRAKVLHRHCDDVFTSALTQAKFSEVTATVNRPHHFTLYLADGNQATLELRSTPHLSKANQGQPLVSMAAPFAATMLENVNLDAMRQDAAQVVIFRDISDEVAVQYLLGHFMANMTHEFRTPLSSLAAGIELLMDQAPELSPAEIQELLLSLHLGVLSLQTLVDNLLESTRLESGLFAIYPRPTDLGELVEVAAQMMQPLLAKYGQQLRVNLPLTLPLVHADPQRTVQVLVNLLANAGKYGPTEAEVEIGATVAKGEIRVMVADRGAGVPAHQREKIFSRFVHFGASEQGANGVVSSAHTERANRTHAASRYGTGLGLWIVKNIIEAQGGTAGVDGRPGGGAIFWFTLQVAEEQ